MDNMYSKPCMLFDLNQVRNNVFTRFGDFQRSVVMIRHMDNQATIPVDVDETLEKFKEELFTLYIRAKELRSCICSRLCRAYPDNIKCKDGYAKTEVCPWSMHIHLPDSEIEAIGILKTNVEKDIVLNYCKIVRTQREWEQYRHEFYESIKQLKECHAGGNN